MRMDVLQRDVLFTRLEITQHEMSLAEGAAGAVLPAQPDGRALANKTAESQRLRVGPVDLGVAGLVTLIVTVAPVAEDVDDHILPETLAVGEGYLCDPCRGFRIVAVDVENWGLDRLRHIRRVGRRTGFLGRGRKPDLIVDDDVNRPPGAVAAEL